MSDDPAPTAVHDGAPGPASNVQELSVSDLSRMLKRTVEDAYSYVRVRGEISGFKRAASGHLYMTLKDSDAVIDAVCWRGTAGRLAVKPEDGLEVVATGRITTYAQRSKYQIVVESLELAGEGALLKLLEERRRKLAEEGLFDEAAKRPLPYLPSVIGVVTSPTGAVIRDILHRLQDRFPRHVLLWPVTVQGETAAQQVADAIAGFNALEAGGRVPRPDVLIVARGGGSLEDLWAFNEEVVVRAAAASTIPLISAVGHETDTTLIDFAADRRAPTPTAAAEIAVPVRAELVADVLDRERRMVAAANRMVGDRARYLEGLARGLPRPRGLIEGAAQRLDDLAERHAAGVPRLLGERRRDLSALTGRLRTPADVIRTNERRLTEFDGRLARALDGLVRARVQRFADRDHGARLATAVERRLREGGRALESHGAMLESLSYRRVLDRGYAVVRDADGAVVSDGDKLGAGDTIRIEFRREVQRDAMIVGGSGKGPARKAKAKGGAAPSAPAGGQQDLF